LAGADDFPGRLGEAPAISVDVSVFSFGRFCCLLPEALTGAPVAWPLMVEGPVTVSLPPAD